MADESSLSNPLTRFAKRSDSISKSSRVVGMAGNSPGFTSAMAGYSLLLSHSHAAVRDIDGTAVGRDACRLCDGGDGPYRRSRACIDRRLCAGDTMDAEIERSGIESRRNGRIPRA